MLLKDFPIWRRPRHVGAEESSLAQEQGRNFFILAGLFAVSAFLPRPLAYWVFGAGVVLIQLQYMLPGVGTLRFERFVPRLGHIAERFGLLMLILLGEGFFKLVVTLADKGIDEVGAGTLFNLVIHPVVPAIVGNLGWGLALFSQIGVPPFWAVRDRRQGDSA